MTGRKVIGLALMALGGVWIFNGAAALLTLQDGRGALAGMDWAGATGTAAAMGAVMEFVFTLVLGLIGVAPLWLGYRLWQRSK